MDLPAGHSRSMDNDADYSFIVFDQDMSPITEDEFLDYQTREATDFFKKAFALGSTTPLNGLSKEACYAPAPLDLGTHPTLTNTNVAIKDDPKMGYISRPRNAFMIYRSEFFSKNKIHRDVEHDNRHISRIIGHCWQKLSKEEKAYWQEKADAEKLAHRDKYPNYKFSPVARSKKPLKRNSRRNGEKDMERCRQVADLLLSGKEGDELAAAIKEIDLEKANEDDQYHYEPCFASRSPIDGSPPAFMNPLRPPRSHSSDLQAVDASYDYNSDVCYEATQRAPCQFYPSPPVSPTSPHFSVAQNTQNRASKAYPLRPARFPQDPSAHTQATQTYTRIHPSPVPPYQTHMQFTQPTSLNLYPSNEQQVGYSSPNNAPSVDVRPTYTFQSSSAYPASPHTPCDNVFRTDRSPRF